MIVEYIKTFFETMLGAALPEWIYMTFGLIILLSVIFAFLRLVFPKFSKYIQISILAITLGYILYNVIPFWGVGSLEVATCFFT